MRDCNYFVDILGFSVVDGAGRTHVKYSGIKNGKPYHGYASASSELNLSAEEIISRRYGGDFSKFDVTPTADYIGEGVEGKWTARGLEQREFEADGGLKGTSNLQNPVGINNKNRSNYLNAADNYLESKGNGRATDIAGLCKG